LAYNIAILVKSVIESHRRGVCRICQQHVTSLLSSLIGEVGVVVTLKLEVIAYFLAGKCGSEEAEWLV